MHTANSHLRDMVGGDPDLAGMGTTVTALLRAGSRFGLVHVGDSRGYLLRDGQLQQITRDHTFVQSLVDEGRITADEADHHPQRNVITNALDGREDVDLDLSIRETRVGDRYLLCSDGLSGVVSEETIRETLADEASTDVAVDRLVELALRAAARTTSPRSSPTSSRSRPGRRPRSPVDGRRGGRGRRQARPGRARPPPRRRRCARRVEEVEADGVDDEPLAHRGRPLVWLGLLLVLLVAAGYGAYRWSQTQYYVGASGSQVAIYRG